MQIIPVILAGGSGTRLWPRSRADLPKQFLDVGTSGSLLAVTVARFADDHRFASPVIVGAAEHAFMIAHDLAGFGEYTLVAEPMKRNTAAAIGAAAHVVAGMPDGNAILCIMPADQIVRDIAALKTALQHAVSAAMEGRVVTIGITPSEPATGYGYIETGGAIEGLTGAYTVERFVEKPDRETAERFIARGGFLWNAGMFVARNDVILSEMARHCPDVCAAAEAAVARAKRGAAITLDNQAFATSPSISFDYAIMEKTRHAAVVPADMGWTDVGSWAALWEIEQKDQDGNSLKGDVLASNCSDCHIESDGGLVVGLGLERMVVVQNGDATLVAPLAQAQQLGPIVERLKAQGRPEASSHRKAQRPWGWYDSLWQAPGYQVKHLMIAPGAAISLQLHHRRSEHWVMLRGIARVTRDSEVFDLQPGQSTFIPMTAKHRLENPGEEELHVIEIQLGDYLGEDDIVRFEDRYNRI